MIKAIWAQTLAGGFGTGTGLPWRNRTDLAQFKECTMGCTVLVGSATARLLPPLPGRTVITVTRSAATEDQTADPREFIRRWKHDNAGAALWVAGGASLIESVLDLIDFCHISLLSEHAPVSTVSAPRLGARGEVWEPVSAEITPTCALVDPMDAPFTTLVLRRKSNVV